MDTATPISSVVLRCRIMDSMAREIASFHGVSHRFLRCRRVILTRWFPAAHASIAACLYRVKPVAQPLALTDSRQRPITLPATVIPRERTGQWELRQKNGLPICASSPGTPPTVQCIERFLDRSPQWHNLDTVK